MVRRALTTRIYMVRHGETDWNAQRRIQGHRDVPLNATGLRQAECVAAALAGEALAAVYSSDLARAAQTADAIAARHGLPVRLEPGLRELGFGAWEGLDETQARAHFPEEYAAWRADSLRHRPTGGETIEELQARAAAVYDRALAEHPGQGVVLVAHGGPIRALVLHALGAPLDAYPRLRMRNASVTLIEVRDEGPLLQLYNHVCFLDGPLPGVVPAGELPDVVA